MHKVLCVRVYVRVLEYTNQGRMCIIYSIMAKYMSYYHKNRSDMYTILAFQVW